MNKRDRLILALIVIPTAAPAFASGFGFYEQGAKASAQSGTWISRADDASANWYNPATLVHLSGREIQFGINYFETGSDTQFSPAPGFSFDAVSNTETPAHLYFSPRINERVAWGVGLDNPFGLVSEWQDFPVTLSSRRAELRTYLLNPNLAFRLGDRWSLALGVDYISAEVREFSRDAIIVTAGAAPTGGPPPTTRVDLSGEGDAWGYNFAVQFKMSCFSLAGQHRSGFKPTIEGGIGFNWFPGPDAVVDVHPSGQTMLGAAWTGKRVDVELGGYYTQWNSFKNLHVETGSPTTNLDLTQNWVGTWSYRLGLAFRLDHEMKHEPRAGAVIDAYGMRIQFDDVTANGSPAGGVINGTYTSTILLAGVTAKHRF